MNVLCLIRNFFDFSLPFCLVLKNYKICSGNAGVKKSGLNKNLIKMQKVIQILIITNVYVSVIIECYNISDFIELGTCTLSSPHKIISCFCLFKIFIYKHLVKKHVKIY